MDYGKILEEAYQAAEHAATVEDARLGPEQSRGFDCGFAWVDIPTPRDMDPVTKGFIKFCKGKNGGSISPTGNYGAPRGHGKAAWQFWSPAHSRTQSVSVHYAGAAAFALVLRNAGIVHAAAGQRLD